MVPGVDLESGVDVLRAGHELVEALHVDGLVLVAPVHVEVVADLAEDLGEGPQGEQSKREGYSSGRDC